MRIGKILAIAIACFAGGTNLLAAEPCSPLSWLGFGKRKPLAARTSEVSQRSSPPTVFARMSHGTKRLVSSTKNLFVPDKPPPKATGVKRSAPSRQSFFQRMFNPQPAPPPNTVNEWMQLDHMHP